MVATYSRYWLLAFAAYLTVLFVLRIADFPFGAILLRSASVIGITLTCLACAAMARSLLISALAFFGSSSLLVYLLHGPTIFHLRDLTPLFGVSWTPVVAMLAVPAIAAVSVPIGMSLQKIGCAWLFKAPWLLKKRGRQKQVAEAN